MHIRGDHLSFLQRLLVILQLCMALSLLLWQMGKPFLGEYFEIKSKLLLFEYVMGRNTASNNAQKLDHQQQQWQQLPDVDRNLIEHKYLHLKNYSERPVFLKITQGVSHLIHLPPFELAWIFFTIILSVLLLKGYPGAFQAVYLMPIIALCYVFDNQLSGTIKPTDPTEKLFPSEKGLIEAYFDRPLSSNWSEQREQLQKAWHRYLVDTYLTETTPQSDQIERAEYQFVLAQIKAFIFDTRYSIVDYAHEKKSVLFLALVMIWNFFYATQLISKPRQKLAVDCVA